MYERGECNKEVERSMEVQPYTCHPMFLLKTVPSAFFWPTRRRVFLSFPASALSFVHLLVALFPIHTFSASHSSSSYAHLQATPHDHYSFPVDFGTVFAFVPFVPFPFPFVRMLSLASLDVREGIPEMLHPCIRTPRIHADPSTHPHDHVWSVDSIHQPGRAHTLRMYVARVYRIDVARDKLHQ